MKNSKGFSAKVKGRIWALYVVHGTKWTAILNDLTNEQRDGKIRRTARIPADERTIRSYIEEREKREDTPAVNKIHSDPLIIKAREEHLSEIRELVGKLRDFKTLEFMDYAQGNDDGNGDRQPPGLKTFKNDPLYACLKEHIQVNAFWEDYSIWHDRWASYMDECNQFWHYIVKEVNEAKKWPGVLGIHHENVYSSIGEIIRGGNTKPVEYLKSWYFNEREQLYANGKEILIVEADAGKYIDKYKGMVQRIVNKAELKSLRDHYEKAVEVRNRVDRRLDEILFGRKYMGHTCRLCPGQAD